MSVILNTHTRHPELDSGSITRSSEVMAGVNGGKQILNQVQDDGHGVRMTE